jgi:hypothetical protein
MGRSWASAKGEGAISKANEFMGPTTVSRLPMQDRFESTDEAEGSSADYWDEQ